VLTCRIGDLLLILDDTVKLVPHAPFSAVTGRWQETFSRTKSTNTSLESDPRNIMQVMATSLACNQAFPVLARVGLSAAAAASGCFQSL
jgi:hypothetical protein